MIANKASLFSDLAPADIEQAVVAITEARRAYQGRAEPTHLSTLADGFIALANETTALGPARSLTLTVGNASSAPIDASAAMVEGLSNTLRGLAIGIDRPWPPAHLPVADMVVLADPAVASALGGLDAHNTDVAAVRTADSHSTPVELRLALCSLALRSSTPAADWALSLCPVGYTTRELRRAWYETLGSQAKVFGTLDRFLDYAGKALSDGGKTFAVGLITHWLLRPCDIERVADITQTDRLDLWTSHPTMRRYGTVLILRRVSSPATGQHGLQMIWYDPWRTSARIREQFASRGTSIFGYRAEVVGKVREWAVLNRVPMHSRYWGGLAGSSEAAADSVGLCLRFLQFLSRDAEMAQRLPHWEDRRGFEEDGFELVEGQ